MHSLEQVSHVVHLILGSIMDPCRSASTPETLGWSVKGIPTPHSLHL